MDRHCSAHDPIRRAYDALDRLAGAPARSGIDLSIRRGSAHIIYVIAIEYDIRRCCATAYHPEVNALASLADHDRNSGSSSCKSIPVRVRRAAAAEWEERIYGELP